MFCPSCMIVNARWGYITCHTGADYRTTPAHILWNPLRWEVGIGRGRPRPIRLNKGGRAFLRWANFRYRWFKTAREREIVRKLREFQRRHKAPTPARSEERRAGE